MTAAPLRKGWCPGALRPMPTGDGLLVRVRVTGGILALGQARGIAACARLFGNGLIDLTARANLQLRGVSAAALAPLTDRLRELGLLDTDAAAEAARNVVASPLAGLDGSACLDIRPITAVLAARLTLDATFHALPPKFCFVVDDGGQLGLSDVAADIRFEAFSSPRGPQFAVRLPDDSWPAGVCSPEAVPDAATALAKAFVALRGTGSDAPWRMRELVESCGTGPIARRAGLRAPHPDTGSRKRFAPNLTEVLGPHRLERALPQHERRDFRAPLAEEGTILRRTGYVGVAAAFGRLAADGLDRLVGTAAKFGAQDLRLTPWRAILVAGLPAEADAAVVEALGSTEFILEAGDPRLKVGACPGAPACARASTPTQLDAAMLAPLLGKLGSNDIMVHVSGCAKGCGQSRSAPVTLVGRDGRYDLVRGGTARDRPVSTGLALDGVRTMLSATIMELAGSESCGPADRGAST